MNNVSSRQYSVELFRVVMMLLIIWGHLLIYGIPERLANGVFLDVKLIIQSFTIIGVNSFVFISGFYGIRFKLNKLVLIMLQAIFYSVLIIILSFLIKRDFNLVSLIKSFFPASTNVWWFLSTYLILYIVSPVLNKGIDNLEKKEFNILLFALLLINCFGGWIFGGFETSGGYSFLHFVTIYIFARYVSVFNIKIDSPLNKYITISVMNFSLAIVTHLHCTWFYFKVFYV